ncbi:endonuclease I [Seonamhaeicola sp. S2-3]|uniref:endonuclease n=1 Tax=Seonamhaeicola sp. S2-3 TaxID=1936081 RepID=UPI00097293F5|nr:endonuclease [Seonamhaeicola sp. S2-3]APY11742.1 endonuclease I [Seonamhaeicola sp. S2-3]
MKHLYLFSLLLSFFSFSQIPSNYYDSADGLSGYALKTELKNIVTNGHTWDSNASTAYDNLYTAYLTTHTDNYYENDGTVLDFYSENPTASATNNDSYNYTHGDRQCGSYNSENDCYNREHLFPQGFFDEQLPMIADVHHVIPTDGYVNNRRSNYPFGEVSNATWTSNNGSKVGPNTFGSYSGTVFEPIDEFKGDIARALLYFAVRYEDNWDDSGWSDPETTNNPLNGTSNQFYEDWYIDLLLDWHANDPVVQAEIDRNNAAYNFQGNANPFVDYPEFAEMIWNSAADNEAPSAPTNLVASNPTDNSIDLSWNASSDNIGVTSYDIYIDGLNSFNTSNTYFTITGLTSNTNYCFTIKAKDAANNVSNFSNQDCETTTNNGSSGGTDCLTESFANITTGSSSYSIRNWTGDDGGSWSATDARTDQSINGSEAITIRNGSLSTPTVSGGIGNLTVTTLRVFSGSSGTFNLKVNGNIVGTIAYSDTEQTITIPNINVSGDVSIIIDGNSVSSNRVIFDDLSWTCYTSLSTESNELISLKMHPNPIKGNRLYFETNKDLDIKIYDILGKLIIDKSVISNNNFIDVSNIKKGIYLVRISNNNQSITKKLIKQ